MTASKALSYFASVGYIVAAVDVVWAYSTGVAPSAFSLPGVVLSGLLAAIYTARLP